MEQAPTLSAAPLVRAADEPDGFVEWMDEEFRHEEFLTIWDVLNGDVAPGPEAIKLLAGFKIRQLDAAYRAAYVSQWQQQTAWTEAQALQAVAAMAGPEPEEPNDRAAAAAEQTMSEELRLALNSSDNYAQHRIFIARTLSTRLPVTGRMLAGGKITAAHVAAIIELSAPLTDEQCATLERRVYPRGERQSVSQFRASVRQVAYRLQPRDFEERHREARKREGVTCWPEPDGMAGLQMFGSAPVVQEVWYAIQEEAAGQAKLAKARGEARVPIAQRRLEVLLRWARASGDELATLGIRSASEDCDSDSDEDNDDVVDPDDAADALKMAVDAGDDLASCSEPTDPFLFDDPAKPDLLPPTPNPAGLREGKRRQRQVGVIIDWDVLLGFREGIAVLEDYGPIPSSVAREMATDAKWRRVMLEEVNGHLLDYGRTRHEPSAKLRDYLIGLGQRCRSAACNARALEVDHGQDWAFGGVTSAFNLNGFCSHTHWLKTNNGFTVINHEDGTLEWVTPSGAHYLRQPDDLRVNDYGMSAEDLAADRKARGRPAPDP